MLAMALVMTASAADIQLPALTVKPLPVAVTVPTVGDAPEVARGSTVTTGLATFTSPHVDQTVSWEPPTGALRDAAIHEVHLVYDALGEARPEAEPALEAGTVAGVPSLSWRMAGAGAWFIGTSFVCPDGRIELTSFGPSDAALAIELTHRTTLDGATCDP